MVCSFSIQNAIFDGKSLYFIFMKRKLGKKARFSSDSPQKTSINLYSNSQKALKILQKNLFLNNSFFVSSLTALKVNNTVI